jgi:glycosyltransferase involved in cell wall biosynthesis
MGDSIDSPLHVVCVCGGYGFPLGTASAARILTVGTALMQGGMDFSLIHCGPSPAAINTQRKGVYQGIRFDYTTAVRRPANRAARLLVYFRGVAGLTARLARLRSRRKRTLIYLYIAEGPLLLYAGWLCRLLRLPLVQELCEWAPGDPECSRFNRWLHKKSIFRLATGALVISKLIEDRVRERSAAVNPRLRIFRLPSIVDARRFVESPHGGELEPAPHFVYCGTWLKDVFFLIRAFAMVRGSGHVCRMRIVGAWPESDRAEIHAYAAGLGIPESDIVFTGCVDEQTLERCYKSAAALLTPLWDDDRSRTRLPNKLGEYLASGRPVVAGRIGDLTDFLIDDVNACLARPGDERDFADRMISMLRDPRRASEIGVAGQQACIDHLDYRAHVPGLSRFFAECASQTI